jgi:hypothetical protein
MNENTIYRQPQIPISWGELLDKISILEIKAERVLDSHQIRNVRAELAALHTVRNTYMPRSSVVDQLFEQLKETNSSLWDLENEIRKCEREGNFNEHFILVARAIHQQNDHRAQLKRQLNIALGSVFMEEKSYSA